MKSLGPSFPCYQDDLLGGTQHMDAEQFGAYWLLLIHQWNYGELPNDGSTLARIGRLSTDQWAKHSKIILEKFTQTTTGGYRNHKMSVIRAERIAYIEKQRAAGRASAEARSNHRSTTVQPPCQPEGEPKGQPKGNLASPSPSAYKSNSRRVEHTITDYDQIHAAKDPVAIAIELTGDRKLSGKIGFTRQYERLGDRVFRDVLCEFFGEQKDTIFRNAAAVLTSKLKKATPRIPR